MLHVAGYATAVEKKAALVKNSIGLLHVHVGIIVLIIILII